MSNRQVVELYGWNEGFQTIDMMKLLRGRAAMQLGDASALVNRILDGAVEKLSLSSPGDAEAFVRDAVLIGARARLEGRDE